MPRILIPNLLKYILRPGLLNCPGRTQIGALPQPVSVLGLQVCAIAPGGGGGIERVFFLAWGSGAWPIIPVFVRPRQEDQGSKRTLDYIVRLLGVFRVWSLFLEVVSRFFMPEQKLVQTKCRWW